MAAITTTRQLRLRPIIPLPHSSLHHFSSSPNPDTSESDNSNNTRPSFSSYFSDVKATLQNNKPNHTTVASLEEIRKNLSEFRARPPPPPAAPSSSTGKHVTLQELYNRNLISNSDNSNPKAPSFDAIRDSLRHLRSNPNPNSAPSKIQKQFDPTSIQRFKETMKLKAEDLDSVTVIGGSRGLNFGGGDGVAMRTEFVKMYDTKELGTKLRMLRPERRNGKWFSLRELNERLVRLREMEERESQGRVGGVTFKDLRETLVKLKISDDEKVKKKTLQRLSVLGQLGGTPDYLLSPPQDNLVDKYFHPDNMSSAEKLKLELKKVRDEFKMSESDCGSARVQVAQLTTKIKHLSTVLQKKDKHSRKGLQAMVQRRKKLLKYLRRTDWDSYCLVLSKLGLRDNPDIKA